MQVSTLKLTCIEALARDIAVLWTALLYLKPVFFVSKLTLQFTY